MLANVAPVTVYVAGANGRFNKAGGWPGARVSHERDVPLGAGALDRHLGNMTLPVAMLPQRLAQRQPPRLLK